MEQYLHLEAIELEEQIHATPHASIYVRFEDEDIQRAMRLKHVKEVIEKLQKTATDVDSIELLLDERTKDREREAKKIRS